MAEGLSPGGQLRDADDAAGSPPHDAAARARQLWQRTRELSAVALDRGATALTSCGRAIAKATGIAGRKSAEGLTSCGTAIAKATGIARRKSAAGMAATWSGVVIANHRVGKATARPRRTLGRIGVRVRRVVATGLYHTGVGFLRLLGIVGLVILLAAMASGLTLPAVVPGAKLVKANIDRFSRFPPLPTDLAKPSQLSTILAADGSTLTWLFDGEIRKIVKFKDVPTVVRQAVLAIEDSRFYEHKGVDYRGIARAARANFEAGEIGQGGSTLTQQYIKLVTNQKKTTLDRKVQEAQYALELERRMSKEQIFENYLNIAYFGDGVYGIATAAEHFFSKSLKQLTLGEAASLAGTIARPDSYNPLKTKENLRRRDQVLDRMAQLGYAPQADVTKAKKAKLKLKIKEVPNRHGYYHSYISGQLQNDPRFNKVLGPVGSEKRREMVFAGGLTVKTTLRPQHQTYAQNAVTDRLRGALEKPRQQLQGAVASVDPSTGAILTVVGGRKFDPSKERGTSSVNFAVSGRGAEGQSPGSAFKAFFMIAALERGFSPLTTYNAPASTTIYRKECPPPKGWQVSNAESSSSGPINMFAATANSVNTYYAQLAAAIGPSAGVEMARRLGVSTIPPKDAPRKKGQADYSHWNVCSAVLGPRSVTPLDMASAYGVLANDGVRCEAYSIAEIKGPDGKVLYKHKPSCKRVLSEKIARTAVDLLQGGPREGTGKRAQIGRPLAGKTGTAQDYTSSYFAGFTPQISTAVWVGYPKPYLKGPNGALVPNSMLREYHGGKVFGGTFAAEIFRQYMLAAHRNLKVRGFPPPPAPVGVPVPDVRGLSVGEATQTLNAAGFSVRLESGDVPGNGIVTDTVPGAGSRVGKGSVIMLRVGDPREGPPDEAQRGGGPGNGGGNRGNPGRP
jgi:membrane peptidoglycan carboxypeptidase